MKKFLISVSIFFISFTFLFLFLSGILFASDWDQCKYKLKIISLSDSLLEVEVLEYLHYSGSGGVYSDEQAVKNLCLLKNNTIESEEIKSGKEWIKAGVIVLAEWSSHSDVDMPYTKSWNFSQVITEKDPAGSTTQEKSSPITEEESSAFFFIPSSCSSKPK